MKLEIRIIQGDMFADKLLHIPDKLTKNQILELFNKLGLGVIEFKKQVKKEKKNNM